MIDYVGEAVDKLITIEAKNHGMPHGILQPMYDAARKAAGNKPVTMTAAEGPEEGARQGRRRLHHDRRGLRAHHAQG